MAAIPRFDSVESAALPPGPLHLAIGMFDGVHLGHRAVIESAVQSARRSGGVAGVLTFRPHPSAILRPDRPTRLILGGETLALLVADLGASLVITQPFSRDFSRMSAEAFPPWLKERLPSLAAVYVGQNWRFGADRKGDVALLLACARRLGLAVFSAPPVNFNGEPVSSTRIRDLLLAGDVATANALLGYTYFAHGTVVAGKRLARTLGYPTLNLPWAPELAPRFGVYAVRLRRPEAEERHGGLAGVANYGLRPTVESAAIPLLETHLLAPTSLGAGDAVAVEWLQFLRPEQKFASLAALRAQVAQDVAAARSLLGA